MRGCCEAGGRLKPSVHSPVCLQPATSWSAAMGWRRASSTRWDRPLSCASSSTCTAHPRRWYPRTGRAGTPPFLPVPPVPCPCWERGWAVCPQLPPLRSAQGCWGWRSRRGGRMTRRPSMITTTASRARSRPRGADRLPPPAQCIPRPHPRSALSPGEPWSHCWPYSEGPGSASPGSLAVSCSQGGLALRRELSSQPGQPWDPENQGGYHCGKY